MELLWAIIGWCILGLIAGAVARLLIPGRQPMGILMTMVLGIVGALLGGFIGNVVMGTDPFAPGGWTQWLLAILGAVIVLGIYVAFARPKRPAEHIR